METTLPLIIYENNILIYSNFETEKIFDCYTFMLKGYPIEKMFNKESVNKIMNIDDNFNLKLTTYNGVAYECNVIKNGDITTIKFLNNIKSPPKNLYTLKLSNDTLGEYILSEYKNKIITIINKCINKEYNLLDYLKSEFYSFCDVIWEYIQKVKKEFNSDYEIFPVLDVVLEVVVGKENITLENNIVNGFAFGVKKKLAILLKNIIKDAYKSHINISETSNQIIIEIIVENDAKNEMSTEFYNFIDIKKDYAKTAGCEMHYFKNDVSKYIIVYDTKKAYRSREKCLDDFYRVGLYE